MRQAETDRFERNRELYEIYKANPDYYDVAFDEASGGMKATHKGHNFNKKGGEYEMHVLSIGFKNGHTVVLGDERGFETKHTEGTWDGMEFEVAGRETASENNILRGLKHCAEKLITEIAVLYFPKGGFDENVLQKALRRYKGLEKLQDGQYLKFKKIICIQNDKIVCEKD